MTGFMILCKEDDQSSVTRAFQFWNEAIDLHSIPKLLKITDRQALLEWASKNQVQELQQHIRLQDPCDSRKTQMFIQYQQLSSC